MKNIVILNTAISSLNHGDNIIMQSTLRELHDVLHENFVVEVPTHSSAFHFYQTMRRHDLARFCLDADLKFVCGTNLLRTNMFHPFTNWNINLFNYKPLNNTILVGVGGATVSKRINYYTRLLFNEVLSSDYYHSVRDEATKKLVEELGLKAINTGCPTTWLLTPELCKSIPVAKSNQVVFTLTDYHKDRDKDQNLINILLQNYRTVYFWPQGAFDLPYFHSLNHSLIKVLNPSLDALEELFNHCADVEYVGTRLHAGIFALQHRKRTIILVIDERAREMNKNIHLNCIERDDIQKLETLIQSDFETNIQIASDQIEKWISQFI